jgi:inorganic triphosphatase YgiF
MLSRGEWEDAFGANHPDLDAPHGGPHLPEGIGGKLRPLFVTDVTRTTVEIEPLPETRIEAAIDEGEVRAAGARPNRSAKSSSNSKTATPPLLTISHCDCWR